LRCNCPAHTLCSSAHSEGVEQIWAIAALGTQNWPSVAMAYWYLAVGLFAFPFCMRLGRGVCGVALAPQSASAS
ncbi:hypothetical protein, partial [Comamonas sp.]|uniref:hypothetical protein n=1 Tax=Comamonas sp. TaxID=34028 RepID=UPI0028A2CD44